MNANDIAFIIGLSIFTAFVLFCGFFIIDSYRDHTNKQKHKHKPNN